MNDATVMPSHKPIPVNQLKFFITTTITAINLSDDVLTDSEYSWRQADSTPDACQLMTQHCYQHPTHYAVVPASSQHQYHLPQQQQSV